MARRLDEERAVRLLARELTRHAEGSANVEVGIGDDAAVLKRPAGKLVLTVDVNVEGVHFDGRWLGLADVGWRSLHAAASDLAAMGARPLAVLSSLILPPGVSARQLTALSRGQALAARGLGCAVVGGNLSRGGELSITTTVVGSATRPLRRRGARPGDELWLLGELGLAAAGLRALQRRLPLRGAAVRRAVQRWRRPEALVAVGQELVGRARAAIDVSDGLGKDAARLAAASGVRVVVQEPCLAAALSPELRVVARLLGESPTELACAGGEDYALLAAGPRARRPRSARVLGVVERGTGAVLERLSGAREPLGSGFDHFS